MPFNLKQEELDRILYKFHRVIYYFEQDEKKSFGYDWQDLYLLRLISEKSNYKMKDLSHCLRIEKFQLTRLVTKLESKKLLHRVHQDNDRRSAYVHITELGKKVIEETKQRHYQLIKEAFNDMNDDKLTIITSFIDSLDEMLLPKDLQNQMKIK